MEWRARARVRRRRASAARSPGAAATIPIAGADEHVVACLTETVVAELLAAELWRRHPDLAAESVPCAPPMTLPNWISLFRILLIPVFMVALLGSVPGGDDLAVVVFARGGGDRLAGRLPGAVAKRRHRRSGTLLDPLADKLLISAALISLVGLDRLAPWVAMVIIAREFAVTGLRLIAVSQDMVIAASPLGQDQDRAPGGGGDRA